MSLGKPTFTLKTYGAELYKWSPSSNVVSKPNITKPPFFCNAVPFSQGEDWVSSYAYSIAVVNYVQQKQAYVECGYSE